MPVDPHLEAVLGFRVHATRSLCGSDVQSLGWLANWSLKLQVPLFGTANQVCTDPLQRFDFAADGSDTDVVNGHVGLSGCTVFLKAKAGYYS